MRQLRQRLNRGNAVFARQLFQPRPQGRKLPMISETPRERFADMQEVHYQRSVVRDAHARFDGALEQPHSEQIQPALRVTDLESLCHRFAIPSTTTAATTASAA